MAFVDFDGFSGDSTFIGLELLGLDNDAVSGDVVTSVNPDDVTNDELLSIDGDDLAVAVDAGRADVLFVLKLLELLFTDVVLGGVHDQNDGDGNEDRDTFNPALGPAFVDDAEDQ